MPSNLPDITIVIPIFNEEAILEIAINSLVARIHRLGRSYEIILAENGSSDRTFEIAERLADEISQLRVQRTLTPNYGRALRAGIDSASGDVVICDEIDLGDISFYEEALAQLEDGADLVVGSKRHPDSVDGRPWVRRQATRIINGLLRVSLGFKGTDTHGLKAFRRQPMLAVVASCTVEHNLFASELVIRAGRAGLDAREIPLKLREIRPPSVGLVRRVPRVLGNLVKLVYVIRAKR